MGKKRCHSAEIERVGIIDVIGLPVTWYSSDVCTCHVHMYHTCITYHNHCHLFVITGTSTRCTGTGYCTRYTSVHICRKSPILGMPYIELPSYRRTTMQQFPYIGCALQRGTPVYRYHCKAHTLYRGTLIYQGIPLY